MHNPWNQHASSMESTSIHLINKHQVWYSIIDNIASLITTFKCYTLVSVCLHNKCFLLLTLIRTIFFLLLLPFRNETGCRGLLWLNARDTFGPYNSIHHSSSFWPWRWRTMAILGSNFLRKWALFLIALFLQKHQSRSVIPSQRLERALGPCCWCHFPDFK